MFSCPWEGESMNNEQLKELESKIVDLIDQNNPRPDMLEAIDVLNNIKNAFHKYLDDNLSSFRKSSPNTRSGKQ